MLAISKHEPAKMAAGRMPHFYGSFCFLRFSWTFALSQDRVYEIYAKIDLSSVFCTNTLSLSLRIHPPMEDEAT